MGIVEYVADGYVHTIEGNSAARVRRQEYPLTDRTIIGYANMTEAMDRAGKLEAPAEPELPEEGGLLCPDCYDADGNRICGPGLHLRVPSRGIAALHLLRRSGQPHLRRGLFLRLPRTALWPSDGVRDAGRAVCAARRHAGRGACRADGSRNRRRGGQDRGAGACPLPAVILESDEPVQSEIFWPTVNYDNVAPFGDPVVGGSN